MTTAVAWLAASVVASVVLFFAAAAISDYRTRHPRRRRSA